MALVFSPLSEDVLESSTKGLRPRTGFVLRQIGDPPRLDTEIFDAVRASLAIHDLKLIDATSSTGAKDYLERILSMIRGTGFTVAIFTESTRTDTLANIALELGFAAMSGKPLIIIKSRNARPPSDLTRTDYINYDPRTLNADLSRSVIQLNDIAVFESQKIQIALEAERADIAIAFERIQKAFLITGSPERIDDARALLERVDPFSRNASISDLSRLRDDLKLFIKQANQSLVPAAP
jgi:hypothetical protein